MESEPEPKVIKLQSTDALIQFSKIYENTFDETCFTPDLIIKIGPEKKAFCCHRLMLAAASDFIQSIISTVATETIAVILLPDVNYAVMEYVLRYIYYGEVLVPTNIYADFVEACKLLQLKGLKWKDQLVDTSGRYDEMQAGSDHYDLEEFATGVVDKIETGDYEVLENVVETMPEIANVSTDANAKPLLNKHPLTKETHKLRSKRLVSLVQSAERKKERSPRNGFNKNNLGEKTRSLNLDKQKNYLSKKIELSPGTEEEVRNLLILCIIRTYERLGITLTDKIESNIKDSKLMFENNKFMRGEHRCGLCDQLCHVGYRLSSTICSIQFRGETFKKHLHRNHQTNLNFVENEMKTTSDKNDSKEYSTRVTDQNELSESEPSNDASEDIIKEAKQRNSSSSGEVQENKQKLVSKAIKLNPAIKKRANEALIRCVQRVYDKLGVSLTPKMKSNINESYLITENNKFIKGVHVCGLCEKPYSINYKVHPVTGNIIFTNWYFKLHFQAKHMDYITG